MLHDRSKQLQIYPDFGRGHRSHFLGESEHLGVIKQKLNKTNKYKKTFNIEIILALENSSKSSIKNFHMPFTSLH